MTTLSENSTPEESNTAVQQVAQLIREKNLENAQKLVKIAQEKDTEWVNRPEVRIQLARLELRLGNERAPKSAEGRAHFSQALVHLERALESSGKVKEDYLWQYLSACVLGKLSEGQAPKEKIKNAWKIHEHVTKAMQLRPEEPGPHNVLGRWCITVATVSRLGRLAAKALFGTPPEATLDEAIKHLLDANKLETPESATFVLNLLSLGEAYQHAKNKTEAKKWYAKCAKSRELQPPDAVESRHERHMRTQAQLALAKLR